MSVMQNVFATCRFSVQLYSLIQIHIFYIYIKFIYIYIYIYIKFRQFDLMKNIRWIANQARALAVTEANYEVIWTQSHM